ncbi:glycosyl hydrolase family 65 protein [Streptomyces camelliae]|uniref:Trehalose 6-phosphate phosphorylase n=1 Tax=Streptomyces camelliae TaxID=3004093 RepID=A0ABY7PG67_9ACTN|nr:glycosyl hydrolase family 65 protein [Streptomyces sp. HUAS 2-6]WBO68607.1 hypothetical protein O1G22_40295 [Streptomyces sp. HUAS 2-6]
MSEWTWEWTGYAPGTERLRESLCTLGNGYFATRGALPEHRAGLVHCPGTYAAGCYNRRESTVAGRQVVNEDLVNLPDWLPLRFRLRHAEAAWGPWFSSGTHTLLDHTHVLDLCRGTLTRSFRHRGDESGLLGVEQTRLVHMGDPHLAALRTVFGVMYPWQSGSDGREETQEWHLNPASGRWLPDHSRLQHHVGSAVAHNVRRYCEATGDTEYLHTKGAEMLLQIARFWADLAALDPGTGRYRIRGVVGPDEYHDSYPGADRPGLDDNAYTNVTAAWVLTRTLELGRRLPAWRREELFHRVRLDTDELPRWDDVSRRLRVPFHEGVISQFEGYDGLAELDWDAYRKRYGTIRRLDRILEAEDDTVNRYKASKQADVLMLGYLFSPAEPQARFRRLGYDLDDDVWRTTVDYYLRRTSHGSTLSGLVHGLVLARARRAEAWSYVREALEADIADIQGGTTGEGIHLGAMAGTLDLFQRGLTGLETREDALWLDPVPLPALSEYGFTLRYRGHWGVGVGRRSGLLEISVPDSEESPIRVMPADRTVTIAPGETCSLVLPSASSG